MTWVLAVRKKTGIDIKPARTKDPATRRAALRDHLVRITDGRPALQVDPDGCPFLRMALGGLYHWPKIRAGMATRDADVPAKNHPHSDVAEAVSVHETSTDSGGMTGMHHLPSLVVEAGSSLPFEPGGYHVMLERLTEDLVAGATVTITLELEGGGTLDVAAEVRSG